jgi:hypothetical protein
VENTLAEKRAPAMTMRAHIADGAPHFPIRRRKHDQIQLSDRSLIPQADLIGAPIKTPRQRFCEL